MYLNEAQISLTGYVATQPLVRMVKSGATNLSMRVAWTPRRQDRVTGEWTDGNTSYATVICWRRLATNGAVCLRKGDPVVVKGRLSVRTYEDKNGVRKVAVEIEASSVGHDLSRGVAQFQRVRPQTGLTASEFAASNGEGAGTAAKASAGTSGAGRPYPQDRDAAYAPPDDDGQDDPFFHDAEIADSLGADTVPGESADGDPPVSDPEANGETGRFGAGPDLLEQDALGEGRPADHERVVAAV